MPTSSDLSGRRFRPASTPRGDTYNPLISDRTIQACCRMNLALVSMSTVTCCARILAETETYPSADISQVISDFALCLYTGNIETQIELFATCSSESSA